MILERYRGAHALHFRSSFSCAQPAHRRDNHDNSVFLQTCTAHNATKNDVQNTFAYIMSSQLKCCFFYENLLFRALQVQIFWIDKSTNYSNKHTKNTNPSMSIQTSNFWRCSSHNDFALKSKTWLLNSMRQRPHSIPLQRSCTPFDLHKKQQVRTAGVGSTSGPAGPRRRPFGRLECMSGKPMLCRAGPVTPKRCKRHSGKHPTSWFAHAMRCGCGCVLTCVACWGSTAFLAGLSDAYGVCACVLLQASNFVQSTL